MEDLLIKTGFVCQVASALLSGQLHADDQTIDKAIAIAVKIVEKAYAAV